MVPYIIIFALISLAAFFDLVAIPKRPLFIGITVLLILFVGTRLVGPDLHTYKSFYLIIPPTFSLLASFAKFTVLSMFEPGYLLLNGIFKSFGSDFYTFNLLFSAAFMYFFSANIRYYSLYPLSGLLVFTGFVYMTSFSAIRQIMAAALFFYGLRYLIEDRPNRYALMIALASFFHFSAFCLFIFYFIKKKHVSSILIIAVLFLLMLLMFSGFFNAIAAQLLHLIPIFPSKIELYINQRSPFWGSVSVFWILTLAICIIYRRQLEAHDKNFNIFFNVLWIGFAIYILATGFGGFGRVLLYFKLAFVVILPLFAIIVREFYGKVLVIAGLGLISGLLYFASILGDTQYFKVNRYLPYQTWLIHDKK